jgi:hypothetical protein
MTIHSYALLLKVTICTAAYSDQCDPCSSVVGFSIPANARLAASRVLREERDVHAKLNLEAL